MLLQVSKGKPVAKVAEAAGLGVRQVNKLIQKYDLNRL